jgi:predicted pyridoxine 5'-phosphate oxidase superfamily flavin-nucleotide-binding protein
VITSPFHVGERAIQSRLGVRDQIEPIGARVIRDHMPAQHRGLYSRLPMLVIGAVDDAGSPWASAVFGEPGFISTPDAKTLSVHAWPLPGDPLEKSLDHGRCVGVLGIELHSRRRNRLSGNVWATTQGFDVRVTQAFGNCPKYILPRSSQWRGAAEAQLHPVASLEGAIQALVDRADSFFIATNYLAPEGEPVAGGGDVSHRGGPPGFARVESNDSLVFPDYPGNNFFNTFGNIECDPRAGLLFPDFARGDLLYLTGTSEILWDETPTTHPSSAARRFVRFSLSHGWFMSRAMPVRWSSPHELNT